VTVKLGGRVPREGKDISDLIGYERRASIFEPTAADNSDTAAKLVSLLEFRQALDATAPTIEVVSSGADKFVAGGDRMRVFRHIFAAKQLLAKNLAFDKAIDLAKAAAALVDRGLESSSAPTAVMANEIYDVRADSARRGDYVNVPDIPRNTMSSVLRGEIEAIIGWAEFQSNHAEESVIHLKRALAIFPADSAWWRTNMWRLGSALAAGGKDNEALESYIQAYKSGPGPDAIRYAVIESIYKRINGNTDGLESRIGRNPTAPQAGSKPSSEPVASTTESWPAPPAQEPARATGTVPAPTPSPAPASVEEKVPGPLPAVYKECNLTASEDNVMLPVSGAPLTLMISSDGDLSLDDLMGLASSPGDIAVTREVVVAGVRSKAVFELRSASGKAGAYTVTFQMPCGKKELSITVK
jgi:tetratricopeptide (TPR) repeat protein